MTQWFEKQGLLIVNFDVMFMVVINFFLWLSKTISVMCDMQTEDD